MKKSENVSSVWERCIYKLMFCSNQIKPSSSGKQLINEPQKTDKLQDKQMSEQL